MNLDVLNILYGDLTGVKIKDGVTKNNCRYLAILNSCDGKKPGEYYIQLAGDHKKSQIFTHGHLVFFNKGSVTIKSVVAQTYKSKKGWSLKTLSKMIDSWYSVLPFRQPPTEGHHTDANYIEYVKRLDDAPVRVKFKIQRKYSIRKTKDGNIQMISYGTFSKGTVYSGDITGKPEWLHHYTELICYGVNRHKINKYLNNFIFNYVKGASYEQIKGKSTKK